MVQVKKEAVREAILGSAFNLFSRNGYHGTTLAQIARDAGISVATVYVYFKSKLDIMYAIYTPWLEERLARLKRDIARMRDPRRKLERLLHTLWCEIPSEQNGFANNLIQAVTEATPADSYDPALLHWAQQEVAAIIRDALPQERGTALGNTQLANVLMMAFDGYVIHRHLRPNEPCDKETIGLMCDLLLGGKPARDKGCR